MQEELTNLWEKHETGAWVCITTNGFVKKNGCLVMGRGTAKQAATRFPELAGALGSAVKTFGNTVFFMPDLRLITFPVKEKSWWLDASAELILLSAVKLRDELNKRPEIQKVYLPRPGCFISGTKVHVPGKRERFGKKERILVCKGIQEVKVGDEVLSYNVESGVKELKRVTKVFKRSTMNLAHVYFSNGNRLVCTLDHPIGVVSKDGRILWESAGRLEIGSDCLQYRYSGLGRRIWSLFMKGKRYDEIFGKERSTKLRERMTSDPSSKRKSVRDKISKTLSGRKQSKEHVEKAREGLLKAFDFGYTIWNKGLSKESDPRVAKSALTGSKTIKALHKDPAFKKKYTDGLNRSPNRAEIRLLEFLGSVVPGEFLYNGNYELGVSFDGMVPDFWNVNGKKKVIELFGDYWHSEEVRGESREDQMVRRKERYAKCGVDCLIVWESELGGGNVLREKIRTFLFNPGVDIVKVVSVQEERLEKPVDVYNLEVERNNNYFACGMLVHNCGNGNLDWRDVKLVLEKVFGNDDRIVVVHQI